MKKILIILFLLSADIILCQNTDHNVYVDYLTAISNVSYHVLESDNNYNYEGSAELKPGFSIGYQLEKGKGKLYFKTGLEASVLRFHLRNEKHKIVGSFGGASDPSTVIFPDIKTSLFYLSVPFEISLKPRDGSKVAFNIGASLDYLFHQRTETVSGTISRPDPTNPYIIIIEKDYGTNTDRSNYNTINFRARLGLDYEINDRFKIHTSFGRNVLNIYDNYLLPLYNNEREDVDLDLDLYSISIGLVMKCN